MRNPFRKSSKSRGLADWSIHHGSDDHKVDNHLTVAPVPSSMPLAPLGYPTGGNNGFGYDGHQPAVQPPTAYPYASQQEAQEEATWEFNAGNNKNVKGHQKGGHIKVGNGSNGGSPMALPQHGRFVFNAGNNVNEGDLQEGGNVEFANVHA